MSEGRTLTLHCGSRFCRGHNLRQEKTIHAEKHIDRNRSKNNVVFYDEPLQAAYDRIFGEAVKEYNGKQTRPDRRIKNYLTKIKKEGQKRPCYEAIVQIGGRDDTGTDDPKAVAVLREYVKGWPSRSPNYILIGAYLHRDESTAHLHLDYIPVAKGHKNGPRLQNSQKGALAAMGFVTAVAKGTAQAQWQQREREVLKQLALNHGIEIIKGAAGRREHLETAIYKKMADKLENRQEADEMALEGRRAAVRTGEQAVSDAEKAVTVREQQATASVAEINKYLSVTLPPRRTAGLLRKVTVPEAEYDQLYASAQSAPGLAMSAALARRDARQAADALGQKVSRQETEIAGLRAAARASETLVASLKKENARLKAYINAKNLSTDYEDWAEAYLQAQRDTCPVRAQQDRQDAELLGHRFL